MDIMKLQPVGKNYIWGGEKLKQKYNKNIDITPLAETWECSVHPDGESLVLNGEYAGQRLAEVLLNNPEYLGVNNDEFPILVKFIDAAQNLSIQVHPSDSYAKLNENQNGKTEMWYVLEAEEDAHLIYGFKEKFSKEEIEQAIINGKLIEYLNKVPAKKGDVFFIPAGTVHAIGEGLVIAEIQENSNLTYRVFDYERVDNSGNKRELHIKKALDVMEIKPVSNVEQNYDDNIECCDYSEETLCKCKYFNTKKLTVRTNFDLFVSNKSFIILLCIEGNGTIKGDDNSIDVQKGECIFIPAGMCDCVITGNITFIKVEC